MSERIRYHLDENVSFAIAQGLRRAGIDVTIPREVGLIGKSDMEHLVFANAEKRVLLTHDDDLLVLAHRGCEHYGITYCRKDARATGQIIRLLILLYEVALADEMKQGGFIFGKEEGAGVTEKQVAKTVKNGLVKAKQKARPDHELYRTIKADPRPSKKQR